MTPVALTKASMSFSAGFDPATIAASVEISTGLRQTGKTLGGKSKTSRSDQGLIASRSLPTSGSGARVKPFAFSK
jgi:hypothetical protein